MITFFRKIRQALLRENRFNKYLIYALGEILLVVLGILIALQINNWNTDYHQGLENKKTLTNLLEEITLNQIELEKKLTLHQVISQRVSRLSEFMSPNPEVKNPEMFDSLILATAWIPQFNALTTVMYSENMKHIDDLNLHKIIAKWSYQNEEYHRAIKITYDLYYNFIYPTLSKRFQMQNLNDDIYFTENHDSKFPVDLKLLLSDSEFDNHLTMRKVNAKSILKRANDVKKTQLQLIDYIKHKLE